MSEAHVNRIMIAGTGSGCGKTTITCAVLKALVNRGLAVASFKCGPDYIDPMFHSEIIKAKSRNLDPFLCGAETTGYLFARNGEEADISVVEGVMGFYDGLNIDDTLHSSCDISLQTRTPVVLVVDCSGLYHSVVAMIKGYLGFCENNIVGVILNNTTKELYPRYRELIENMLSIRVLGYMPFLKGAALESRHLGLVTAAEIHALDDKMALLAKTAEECIDMDGLIEAAKNAPPLAYREIHIEKIASVRIAIAQDKAFCFYYEDSLDLLRRLGAELVPFSPLNDSCLPENIDGLILGGGYPELHAETLSANMSMLRSVGRAYRNGLPTYAECGGFMYLGDSITVAERCHPMVGAIKTGTTLTDRLQHFGYIGLSAMENTVFCSKGGAINAHEFHYSHSDDEGSGFEVSKGSTKNRCSIFCSPAVYAGYPHLHLWGNIDFARNFIRKCGEVSQ